MAPEISKHVPNASPTPPQNLPNMSPKCLRIITIFNRRVVGSSRFHNGFYMVFCYFLVFQTIWHQVAPNMQAPWTKFGWSEAATCLVVPSLRPTWHRSCSLQTFKPTTRPPNGYFASFLKALCLQKTAKNTDFPKGFWCFWNPSRWPPRTLQASLPSPNSASIWPPGPAKKGQGGPKIAQDGPKTGPERCAAQRSNPAR